MKRIQQQTLRKRTKSQCNQYQTPVSNKILVQRPDISNYIKTNNEKRNTQFLKSEITQKYERINHAKQRHKTIQDNTQMRVRSKISRIEPLFRQEAASFSIQKQGPQPVDIYRPLLPRRHKRSSIKRSFQLIQQRGTIDFKDSLIKHHEESNMHDYKHPMFSKQKLYKFQIYLPKLGKIKNQTEVVQLIKMRQVRARLNLKRFRKVANSILFLLYLKRQLRQQYLKEATFQGLSQKIAHLIQYAREEMDVFFKLVSDYSQNYYCITQKDSLELKIKKNNAIRQFLNSLLDCLSHMSNTMSQDLCQFVYFVCKHGSYSCGLPIHTAQELDLLCLSAQQGYIRCDQYLQKNSILMFVFVKIIIYNVLFDSKIQTHPSHQKYLQLNVNLIGDLMYAIVVEVQKQLQLSNPSYKVGNWRALSTKFGFNCAQTMTVVADLYQNQLISGIDTSIMKQYRIDEMKQQKEKVVQTINNLHVEISKFHVTLRKKIF